MAAVQEEVTHDRISKAISSSDAKVHLVPGFIAADAEGHTTTLGRGGSDYTASIYAAALGAESLEIWTDVSGMMTADPRLCANARIIPAISYKEAMELSHFGAKVIYPPTIQPVMSRDIPVWIKNTFAPDDPGTLIHNTSAYSNKDQTSGSLVTGISSINHIALLTLEGSGMIGVPGFSKRFFDALSRVQVNVIMITQSSSEHTITVGIHEAGLKAAQLSADKEFEREIHMGQIRPMSVESGMSMIALVGERMREHTGVSGKMFTALARNGINIRAIAQGSSEMNITAVIQTQQVKKAVNVLHEAFFEKTFKQVNLFICGAGNVGKRLLHQLKSQQDILERSLNIQLRLTGIANSKKFAISDTGISWDQWQQALEEGHDLNLNAFVNEMIGLNVRNAVFVDVTASADVASVYETVLSKSIAVVACNKVAASSAYVNYRQLKSLSAEYNAPFLFETNVGAGLPVIGTISDLVNSGDSIRSVEAVLSGTLNFVFNHYDGSKSFAEVVQAAQDAGYTEPDPRLDLNGSDVVRKILILARESGASLEFDEVENVSFMPQACMKGTVEDFYQEMSKHEAHFQNILKGAKEKGMKLKFVATFKDGKASVGLKHISPEHDFYHLYGKDNIVLFYTDRYAEQPLVIKGSGAGADVTASGVFADILRAIKK